MELKKVQEDDTKKIYTVFHKAEDYLIQNYDFRYNTIGLDIECKPVDSDKWETANENALWLELQKTGINISLQALKSILKSDFVPKFNPIKKYFNSLKKWDQKTDYITEFASYVKLINPKKEQYQFYTHFKKWLVRVVKTIMIENYFNKQAFILADNGYGQNIGKTTYLRYLMPKNLNQYIAEDIGNDKDARILLCKNMLINMDELATLSKKEINHLKAYFTKNQVNERLPYDSKNTIIPRIASFMGSTNQSTFLRDETGSVRWLIFAVKDIDWSYATKFNINNLWSQALYLANDKDFDEVMSRDDIIENEKRNKQYQVLSKEQELIYKYFNVPKENEDAQFMTSSEIAIWLKEKENLNKVPYEGLIGKAMHGLGFKRIQEKLEQKDYPIYGYRVVKIEKPFKPFSPRK